MELEWILWEGFGLDNNRHVAGDLGQGYRRVDLGAQGKNNLKLLEGYKEPSSKWMAKIPLKQVHLNNNVSLPGDLKTALLPFVM